MISFRQADLLMTNQEVADQKARELEEHRRNSLLDLPPDDIETNPNIANVIKEVLRANENDFLKITEFYDYSDDNVMQELEWRSRSGFHSHINGGFQLIGMTSIDQMASSGNYPGNKEVMRRIQSVNDEVYKESIAMAKRDFAEEVKGIPDEKINYHDLYEMGKGTVAERISEFETETLTDYNGHFYVKVFYYNPTNYNKKFSTKRPEIYVQGGGDGSFDHTAYAKAFMFSTLTELRTVLDKHVRAAIKAMS